MSKPRPSPSEHRLRADCRGCGSIGPRRFLSLGDTALANAFLRSSEQFAAERTFPLDVYVCERCTLVQLLDVIDPALLFSEYLYVTGTSDTMRSHYAEYASSAIAMLDLGSEDLVVEVASNDGSLLECIYHGARFDVRSGRAMRLPAIRPVKTFPVEVRDGAVFVEV